MELSDEQFALICRRVGEGKVEAKKNEFNNIVVGPFTFSHGTTEFTMMWLEKMTDLAEKERKLKQARDSDRRYSVLSDIMRIAQERKTDEKQAAFLKQLETL